eukprot:jgi/Astpho2/8019/fgenesh1_pg.00120_%23_15_t
MASAAAAMSDSLGQGPAVPNHPEQVADTDVSPVSPTDAAGSDSAVKTVLTNAFANATAGPHVPEDVNIIPTDVDPVAPVSGVDAREVDDVAGSLVQGTGEATDFENGPADPENRNKLPEVETPGFPKSEE